MKIMFQDVKIKGRCLGEEDEKKRLCTRGTGRKDWRGVQVGRMRRLKGEKSWRETFSETRD